MGTWSRSRGSSPEARGLVRPPHEGEGGEEGGRCTESDGVASEKRSPPFNWRSAAGRALHRPPPTERITVSNYTKAVAPPGDAQQGGHRGSTGGGGGGGRRRPARRSRRETAGSRTTCVHAVKLLVAYRTLSLAARLHVHEEVRPLDSHDCCTKRFSFALAPTPPRCGDPRRALGQVASDTNPTRSHSQPPSLLRQ